MTTAQVNASTVRPKMSSRLFDTVDTLATALFSLEGAMAATVAGFDLLGAIVVGFIVGLGGGILRDILLGDLPPAALRSPARIIAAVVAAMVGFLLVLWFPDSSPSLQYFDAAGLALFAVAGAQKAYECGSNLLVITVMGGITATGGGVLRDILLQRAPYALSTSVYASAALVGALATGIILLRWRQPRTALIVGFAVAFTLRVLAIIYDWNLPSLSAV